MALGGVSHPAGAPASVPSLACVKPAQGSGLALRGRVSDRNRKKQKSAVNFAPDHVEEACMPALCLPDSSVHCYP